MFFCQGNMIGDGQGDGNKDDGAIGRTGGDR